MGKIAPEEQFLPFSTIFYDLMLDFYVKTGIRFSLRDKRLFEITEVEITRVDCMLRIVNKCGKVFSERQYLNRHMVSHEKLSCSSCSKTFTRLDNLERHEKRQHGKEKRIEKHLSCQFCDLAFETYKERPHHISLRHADSTKNCSYCNTCFSRKDNLVRHQRKQHTHSTSSKRQFRCNHCDYVFTDYKKLFAHVSSQHPLGKIQTGGAQTTNSISAKRKSPAQHRKALGINNNAKNGHRELWVSVVKRESRVLQCLKKTL